MAEIGIINRISPALGAVGSGVGGRRWFIGTSNASTELFRSVVTVFSDWPGSPGTELVPFVCCRIAFAKHIQLASSWLLVHNTKPAVMKVPTVGP